ncbi:RloB domain-containing protein [Puteibacter caeruleilacunae]|nr:RloB domain-containing protein [Puteibacter caeruleilacunae]
MGSKRRAPRGKTINPKFWIFCEGESEEAYVIYLKQKYRLPTVKVISKIIGANIDERIIKSHKKSKDFHEKDRDFLLYDADVTAVLERLLQIKDATLIVSNPCIELWYLLHYKNQCNFINNEDCIRQLENRNRTKYKKGALDSKLRAKLDTNGIEAKSRAIRTNLFNNPSTNIYELIEAFEAAKNGKI